MNVRHSTIIERLGGITAVAKRLGIKPPSVAGWVDGGRDGIPDGRLIELGHDIERATGGDVRRWDLRPDDWHLIWPELIGTAGAPVPKSIGRFGVAANAPTVEQRASAGGA